MSANFFLFLTKNVDLILLNFKIGVIFIFSSLKVWEVLNLFWPRTIIKPPTYTENTETALKIWNFWYLQWAERHDGWRTGDSSGDGGGDTGGGRGCARMCCGLSPHSSGCRGGRWGLPSSPGLIGKPAGPCPGHLGAWFWVLFVVVVCFVLFCCVKEETENRKHDPFSSWLTQNTWDKPWTPRRREALVWPAPELRAPEKNPVLPAQHKLTCLACCGPPPPVAPTPSPLLSLSKETCILSFIIFFWLKWHYKYSFESFSIVSSYIAQFRNFSETDFISNLTGKDHIHAYVAIHFYFIGLTQDHFSDANCVPSGLTETVLDFSETLMKSPTVV